MKISHLNTQQTFIAHTTTETKENYDRVITIEIICRISNMFAEKYKNRAIYESKRKITRSIHHLSSSWPPEYTKKSLVTHISKYLFKNIYYLLEIRKTYIPLFFTFLLWKQTIRFSAIGIFILYITATALVTK